MQVIPLAATPAQEFNTTLDGQDCFITIRSKSAFPRGWVPLPQLAVDEAGIPFEAINQGLPLVTDTSEPPLLFLDLAVNGTPLLSGVPCLCGVRIVQDVYWGFYGDLAFFDSEGTDDPQWAGLGSRWFLAFLDGT